MIYFRRKLIVMCFLLQISIVHSQPSNILRGVYLFGESDVNFDTLKNALHMNAFQVTTGFGGAWDDAAMNNSAGLRVINQRVNLSDRSSAQRMIYQAEKTTDPGGLKNYFADRHPDRQPVEADTSIKLAAPGTAGYMVKSAVPDDEYRYAWRGTQYYATYRLKVEGTYSPTTEVATATIWCKTHNNVLKSVTWHGSDFPTTSVYKDILVDFTLTPPPQPVSPPKYLTGGMSPMQVLSPCKNVDLQLYWHGQVTTYLDKITVEDPIARDLFAGTYDNALRQEATTYGNYTNHDKFYLTDEPFISAFLGFNYVGNRIKEALGSSNPRSSTVSATFYAFDRFLLEGGAAQLMIDPYFINSEIPHPSITDNTVADAAGIERWDYNTYLSRLQLYIDQRLHPRLSTAAVAAKKHEKQLIFIPQLHGILWEGTKEYRIPPDRTYDLRPPSPSEIRLQYNIGLAYGAKGFLPYPYGTDYWHDENYRPLALPGLVSDQKMNGFYVDHANNINTIYGKSIWTGYKEKWDETALMNSRLEQIGDLILSLNWQGVKSWSGENLTTGVWANIVTAVSTKDVLGVLDVQPYVEVGHLMQGTTNYLIVVNRRCADSDTRDISVTLDTRYSWWLVTNTETNSAFIIPGGGAIVERFKPGEGKIFKLEKRDPFTSTTSTALSSNSQRKLVQTTASSGDTKLYMAYESGGGSFFTKYDDFSGAWNNELPIGGVPTSTIQYKSPSVVLSGNGDSVRVLYVKNDLAAGNSTIKMDIYDTPTNSLVPSITLGSATGSQFSAPVAAWTRNYTNKKTLLAAAWKSGSDAVIAIGGYTGNSYPLPEFAISSSSLASLLGVSSVANIALMVDDEGSNKSNYYIYLAWDEPGTNGGIKFAQGKYTTSQPWPPQVSQIDWTVNSPGTSKVFVVAANTSSQTNSNPTITLSGMGDELSLAKMQHVWIAWQCLNAPGQGSIKTQRRAAMGGTTYDPTKTIPNPSGTSELPLSPSLTDYRFAPLNTNTVALVWHSNTNGTLSSTYKVAENTWSAVGLINSSGRQASVVTTTNTTIQTRAVAMVGMAASSPYPIMSVLDIPHATDPPLPPTLSGTTSNNHPSLSWTAVAGATSYTLYRYYCPNPPDPDIECGSEVQGTVVYSGTALSYADNGIWIGSKATANTMVVYYVKAKDNFFQYSEASGTRAYFTQLESEASHTGEDITEKLIPTETKLAANYPNPFNPTTRFDYQLAQEGHVTLIVYNLLGQEVARLIDEYRDAGYFNIAWDASSQSSSLYYARMIVTDVTGKQQYLETRKLLLMK